MSKLSSGNYIIERVHPILKTLATVQSSMQRLMTIDDISSEVFNNMRQKLKLQRKRIEKNTFNQLKEILQLCSILKIFLSVIQEVNNYY